MESTNEGAQLQLPVSSNGSVGTSGGCPSPPLPGATGGLQLARSVEAILVSKVLTYSDVSTEVARTGRIVLPRLQVQQCLPELLRLCQAEHALPPLRSGGPVKLSVDLVVEDEAGRTWVVLMKTWQNIVSGEFRPTYVLENTADFVRANHLVQGDTLAFCPHKGRMLLRTSLPADQLLPRTLKRAATAAAGPTAKRRVPASRSPLAASTPEPPALAGGSHSRRRKPPATHDAPCSFWQPSPGHAAEAAAALLQMHSAGCSSASESEQLAVGEAPSPVASTGATAAAATADMPFPQARSRAGSPTISHLMQAAMTASRTVRGTCATDCKQQVGQQRQQQQHRCGPDAQAVKAAATSAVYRPTVDLLPPALPLSSATPPLLYHSSGGDLPAEAMLHAHRWLATLLAQHEQERAFLEQYNHMLLLQVLQAQQEQAQQRFLTDLHA